ncbi:MAG: GWxTD domain-containing protein [Bacteroidia bacterium]|nr:GWxTD domain-containing protein [Bacteroidia bacterium]
MKKRAHIFGIGLLVLLMGCFGSSKISNQNLAFIYKKDNVFSLQPLHTIHHFSKDSTRVYLSISSDDLLYKNEEVGFTANFKILYKLYDSFESETVLDSSSFTLKDRSGHDESKELFHQFEIATASQIKYLLEISVHDLNNNQKSRNFIQIDRSNFTGRQNFLIGTVPNNNVLFRDYISINEKIKIDYPNEEIQDLVVDYYVNDFEIAVPPFFNNYKRPFDYEPDSTFQINIKSPLTFKKKGLYHLRMDTMYQYGITIHVYNNSFPDIKTVDQLVYPLRYITTKKEFAEIENSEKSKYLVDKLWLEMAGNKERARSLIRHYYGRVRNANKYFTSFKEGWKTDRGIIYIVFGPPHAIYKNTISETWIYGEENNMLSITFNFTKVKNPFTNNDYDLERQILYQNSWYMAVDNWRHGFVYNSD